MQVTFTGYHPRDDREGQEILRHIANGEYEVLLYSNYGKGQSLLQARYVILRQPGAPIGDTEGLHEVIISPPTDEDAVA